MLLLVTMFAVIAVFAVIAMHNKIDKQLIMCIKQRHSL